MVQNKWFWTSSGQDAEMRKAKKELIQQIRNLNISINSNGFFEVDRRLLISVSITFLCVYL